MDTSAAAASATIGRPTFNPSFFLSPAGLFKVTEFVLSLLVWPLIVSVFGYSLSPELQFVLFVSITVWILTTLLIVMYMFSIHSTALSGLPWDVTEFFYNLFWTLMYFIAACVEASVAHDLPVLIASTIFAFFITIVFIAHTLFAFKTWRGSLPWDSSNGGNDVNT